MLTQECALLYVILEMAESLKKPLVKLPSKSGRDHECTFFVAGDRRSAGHDIRSRESNRAQDYGRRIKSVSACPQNKFWSQSLRRFVM